MFSVSQRARPLGLASGAILALTVGAAPAASQDTALEEIVVTSPSPVARPGPPAVPQSRPVGVLNVIENAFAAVTVVPRDEIVRGQPRTLADALADKPGVAGTSFVPGAADRPVIRGLEGPRVRILENGLGVHDVSALGEDHAVPVNPLVDDRVEVIRGPATLRYGSQAVGGVVSAENGRVPKFEPPGGFSAEVLSGLSSVDRGRNAAARIDAGADGVVVHADGFRSETGNYQTPDGEQANSATRATGGSVGVSRVFENGFFGIAYSRFDALYHVPGEEAAEGNVRLDPKQDKVQAQGEHRFDGGPFSAIRFWINGSDYKHNEIAIGEDSVDGVQATFKNRETESRIELQHAPVAVSFGRLTGAIGLQAGYGELRTSGEAGGLIAPTDSGNVAAYLFEELDAGSGFRFQAAGRIERATVDGAATTFPGLLPDGTPLVERDARKDFTPVSVSFGALKDLAHGFVASVTGQYVERAPTGLELFSKGPHDAPGLFEIGDPDLSLEKARSLEIGLRRAEGPFRFDASAYYTRFDGFVFRRLTGVQCGDDFDSCGVEDELDQVVYSQQDATFKGAEVAGQFDAFAFARSVLGFDAQYDFVRAKFADGSNVPRIPPHRLSGGVFWRHDEGLYLRVGLTHAFTQTKTAAFETRTPGYDRLKAEASWTRRFDDPGARVKEITVGVVGDNLLDARIRNAASFKKDEILLPGANVRAYVAARF
jgi:iron complex outermembrane receptor protein